MKEQRRIDLEKLRTEIDVIDKEIIVLLANRFRLTHNVGQLKLTHSLDVVDEHRESRQFKQIIAWAVENELNPEIAVSFLRFIIDKVVIEHKNLKEN